MKTKCRKLVRKILRPCSNDKIVVDDEHYVYLDSRSNASNRYYNSSNRLLAPSKITVLPSRKFCPKLLVWLAISEKGRSEPYIAAHKQNIDQTVYLNNCIKKRLIPFLKAAYPEKNAIFWPDKARAHYAKSVTEYLQKQGIQYVDRDSNPTNVPQARPIEAYWAELDRRLSLYRTAPKDLRVLKRRIEETIKKIPDSFVQDRMKIVRKKLRKIADAGPYAVKQLYVIIVHTLPFLLLYLLNLC